MRAAFLLLVVALRLGAQVIETPVPFDSAGKVRSITPPLANRLVLAAPAWPVQGDFVEARLFTASSGETVLVVERRSGVVERWVLGSTEAAALRSMVEAALARAGAFVAEEKSEPARRAFARNQMILGTLLYGPGMAALASDGKTATVLYLVGAGGTYFAVSALARDMYVTRAQNHLATDGALRGFAAANGLLLAVAGDLPDRKTVSGVGLAGAVGGSVAGFHYGRRFTDAEAHASTTTSSFAALTALGILGATDALESANSERGVAAILIGSGLLGYLAGPGYPRRPGYTVTAGDVKILWVGAALTTAAATTPIVDSNVDPKFAYAVATAGMLAGIALTDRAWVRSYDHTMSDVFQTWLGTIAGSLLGAAVIVLTEPSDSKVAMGLVTAGAIAGAITAHNLVRPAPAGERRAGAEIGARVRDSRVVFAPLNLALAAAKVRGAYPLLSVSF